MMEADFPHRRRWRRLVIPLALAAALVVGGIVLATRPSPHRIAISLVVIDSTAENRVPSSASVRVGNEPRALLQFERSRSTPLALGSLVAGDRTTVRIWPDGPSDASFLIRVGVRKVRDLPTSGRVVVEVKDDEISTTSDVPGVGDQTFSRANPIAAARRADALELGRQVRLLRQSMDTADELWREADDRYQAIYGEDNRAPFSEIAYGLEKLVRPKLDEAAGALSDAGLSRPEVREVYETYSEALRLERLGSFQELQASAHYTSSTEAAATYSEASAARDRAYSALRALENRTDDGQAVADLT
jgi:hypothetical protein